MSSVLVVDDQLTSRMILAELIRTVDPALEVHTFEDPVLALDWAKNNPHDLVITDYLMPGMDGVEFTQWLRKIPNSSDVPVVMVTHKDEKAIRYRALEAGATDFLGKPIDHYECRARCKNLLELRQHQAMTRDRAQWLEDTITEKTRELRMREKETLLRLAKAGEYRDLETGSHIMRMAYTTRIIAETLGQNSDFCDTIEHAAPMHDIGKIGIPDRILLKPGRLTTDERLVMQRHTRIGYEILRDSPSKYLQVGAMIAWCHHESFNGKGYPRGIKGTAIPLEARIVALADTFDALLSNRPYKKPWDLDKTVEYIRSEKAKQFDPDCIDALLHNLDRIMATRELFSDEEKPASPTIRSIT